MPNTPICLTRGFLSIVSGVKANQSPLPSVDSKFSIPHANRDTLPMSLIWNIFILNEQYESVYLSQLLIGT